MTSMDGQFAITHTKGDTFDYTLTIKKSSVNINWSSEGYASGVCKVKTNPSQTDADLTLTVDITTNGALRLYSSSVVTLAVGTYYYDIEFTKTGSKKETWFNNTPSKFIITQDVS